MLGKLKPLGIAALAFAAGSVVSFFLLPIWVVPLIEYARTGSPSDWLGFAGAVIGSVLTSIVAGGSIVAATRGIPRADQRQSLQPRRGQA
jgi:hypothetical protein